MSTRGVALTRTIEGVGNVLAAEAVTITAEAAGRVGSIAFAQKADVAQGAVLVHLNAEQENADVATRVSKTAELRVGSHGCSGWSAKVRSRSR